MHVNNFHYISSSTSIFLDLTNAKMQGNKNGGSIAAQILWVCLGWGGGGILQWCSGLSRSH
jgi:hypothetical protein